MIHSFLLGSIGFGFFDFLVGQANESDYFAFFWPNLSIQEHDIFESISGSDNSQLKLF